MSSKNDGIKRLRSERKAAGLCIECGRPSERTRCEGCRRKNTDAQKRSQDQKRSKGVCVSCGCPREGRSKKCDKCRGIQERANKKCYERKTTTMCCVVCGKEKSNRGTRCSGCNVNANSREKTRRDNFIAQGRCRYCGNEAQLSPRSVRGRERGLYCKKCWLKTLALNVLGSMKHWAVLVEKLDACGWRCPYSGEPLVLGDNLSFDHINPICRFPEQRYDPDNVEPISWQLNLMKRDLTREEFLNFVEKVYLNCKRIRE